MPQQRNQRTIRILHIIEHSDFQLETYVADIAKNMQKFAIQFDVVTFDHLNKAFQEAIQSTGGDVYQIQSIKDNNLQAFAHSFQKVLDLYHYNVIHCHVTGYHATLYRLLSRKFNIPKFYVHAHEVNTYQGFIGMVQRIIQQQLNRYVSDGYMGTSTEAIKSAYGYEIQKQEMMRIPFSVDQSYIMWSEQEFLSLRRYYREKYQLSNKDCVFGYVHPIHHTEDLSSVIRLAEYIQQKNFSDKIVILTNADALDVLTERVEAHQLSKIIKIFESGQDYTKMLPIFDAMMLFPNHRDAFKIAVESQAAGIGVVTTNGLTNDADLGINLMRRIDSRHDVSHLYEFLTYFAHKQRLSQMTRQEALQKHQYTQEEVARLYQRFIRTRS